MSTTTRAPRGKSIVVNDMIQALVLKKALASYITEQETKKDTTNTDLVSTEDIINAAEEILDNVDALAFFHKAETNTASKKVTTNTNKKTTAKATEATA